MKYNDSILNPPGAVVTIIVRPARKPEPFQSRLAELDTGASISVIPESLVDDLRLVPRKSVTIFGYDDKIAERDAFSVDLEIEGYKLRSVKVVSAPRKTILLGRDVLNHFIITLDGKALTFEMQDP